MEGPDFNLGQDRSSLDSGGPTGVHWILEVLPEFMPNPATQGLASLWFPLYLRCVEERNSPTTHSFHNPSFIWCCPLTSVFWTIEGCRKRSVAIPRQITCCGSPYPQPSWPRLS